MEIAATIDDARESRGPDKNVAERLAPQRLPPGNLGVEAMAADIEAVAVVDEGPGKPANLGQGLKHHRGFAAPRGLEGCREAGRPGSDHDETAKRLHRRQRRSST